MSDVAFRIVQPNSEIGGGGQSAASCSDIGEFISQKAVGRRIRCKKPKGRGITDNVQVFSHVVVESTCHRLAVSGIEG